MKIDFEKWKQSRRINLIPYKDINNLLTIKLTDYFLFKNISIQEKVEIETNEGVKTIPGTLEIIRPAIIEFCYENNSFREYDIELALKIYTNPEERNLSASYFIQMLKKHLVSDERKQIIKQMQNDMADKLPEVSSSMAAQKAMIFIFSEYKKNGVLKFKSLAGYNNDYEYYHILKRKFDIASDKTDRELLSKAISYYTEVIQSEINKLDSDQKNEKINKLNKIKEVAEIDKLKPFTQYTTNEVLMIMMYRTKCLCDHFSDLETFKIFINE